MDNFKVVGRKNQVLNYKSNNLSEATVSFECGSIDSKTVNIANIINQNTGGVYLIEQDKSYSKTSILDDTFIQNSKLLSVESFYIPDITEFTIHKIVSDNESYTFYEDYKNGIVGNYVICSHPFSFDGYEAYVLIPIGNEFDYDMFLSKLSENFDVEFINDTFDDDNIILMEEGNWLAYEAYEFEITLTAK